MLVTTAGAVAGATTYGVAFQRHHVGVTHASLPISRLPQQLDGLRIGLPESARSPAADSPVLAGLNTRENPSIFVCRGIPTVYVPVRPRRRSSH